MDKTISTDSKYLVLMDDAPDGELSTLQVVFGLDALCTTIDKIAFEMAPAAHEGVSIYSLTAMAKAHAKRLAASAVVVPPGVHAVDLSKRIERSKRAVLNEIQNCTSSHAGKPTDAEPEQPDPDEATKAGPPDWDAGPFDAREAARHCLAISERALCIASAAEAHLKTEGEVRILDDFQIRELAYQILAFETHLADAVLHVQTHVDDFPRQQSGLFRFQDVSKSKAAPDHDDSLIRVTRTDVEDLLIKLSDGRDAAGGWNPELIDSTIDDFSGRRHR